MKNYYKVLGISETASKEEIEDSYQSFQTTEKYKQDILFQAELDSAYETLIDDRKRVLFDVLHHKRKKIEKDMFGIALRAEHDSFGWQRWIQGVKASLREYARKFKENGIERTKKLYMLTDEELVYRFFGLFSIEWEGKELFDIDWFTFLSSYEKNLVLEYIWLNTPAEIREKYRNEVLPRSDSISLNLMPDTVKYLAEVKHKLELLTRKPVAISISDGLLNIRISELTQYEAEVYRFLFDIPKSSVAGVHEFCFSFSCLVADIPEKIEELAFKLGRKQYLELVSQYKILEVPIFATIEEREQAALRKLSEYFIDKGLSVPIKDVLEACHNLCGPFDGVATKDEMIAALQHRINLRNFDRKIKGICAFVADQDSIRKELKELPYFDYDEKEQLSPYELEAEYRQFGWQRWAEVAATKLQKFLNEKSLEGQNLKGDEKRKWAEQYKGELMRLSSLSMPALVYEFCASAALEEESKELGLDFWSANLSDQEKDALLEYQWIFLSAKERHIIRTHGLIEVGMEVEDVVEDPKVSRDKVRLQKRKDLMLTKLQNMFAEKLEKKPIVNIETDDVLSVGFDKNNLPIMNDLVNQLREHVDIRIDVVKRTIGKNSYKLVVSTNIVDLFKKLELKDPSAIQELLGSELEKMGVKRQVEPFPSFEVAKDKSGQITPQEEGRVVELKQ